MSYNKRYCKIFINPKIVLIFFIPLQTRDISDGLVKLISLYSLTIFTHSVREETTMKVSARNSIKGTIKSIKKGMVNAEIVLDIGNGAVITSVITLTSAESLGLKEGMSVYAVIKASEVMIGTD